MKTTETETRTRTEIVNVQVVVYLFHWHVLYGIFITSLVTKCQRVNNLRNVDILVPYSLQSQTLQRQVRVIFRPIHSKRSM